MPRPEVEILPQRVSEAWGFGLSYGRVHGQPFLSEVGACIGQPAVSWERWKHRNVVHLTRQEQSLEQTAPTKTSLSSSKEMLQARGRYL